MHTTAQNANMHQRAHVQIAVSCYPCLDKWLHLISLTVCRRQGWSTGKRHCTAPVNAETQSADKQHGRSVWGKAARQTEPDCCDEGRYCRSNTRTCRVLYMHIQKTKPHPLMSCSYWQYKIWTKLPGLKSEAHGEVPQTCILSDGQQGSTPLVLKTSLM